VPGKLPAYLARLTHDPYLAIRSSNFRWYAGGFFLASMGNQMLSTAIGWEIFARTHSELHLGYTGLARSLPVVFLSLIGGHTADVFDRRRILIITQLVGAATIAALAYWSGSDLPLLVCYLLLGMLGCVRAFNGPARGSLMPQLVPPESFHNAVTWSAGLFHASGVLGPLAAGFIIALTQSAWQVYALSAFFMFFFALSALRMKPLIAQSPGHKFSMASLLGGMSFVFKDKPIFGALLIDCLGVLLGGATALLPKYADDILHVGPQGLGWLRAAVYLGAVTSAVVLAYRKPFQHAGWTFLIAVALWALCVIGFGFATNFYLSFLFLFLQGAIDNVSVVIRHVLVQARTPDAIRGRVSAVNGLFIDVSNELGAYESGLMASWLGTVTSVVGGGVGTLLVVSVIAVFNKPLRQLGVIQSTPKS
jgi:MFS family permease